MPFEDESVDLVIANQVFEHVKELYWIVDQIARILTVGGQLIVGLPNICSLTSRLLVLAGRQPSQMRAFSGHVRGFGPSEFPAFLDVCFPGGFRVDEHAGAQFYPFPPSLARLLCRVRPSMAHVTMLRLSKLKPYGHEILQHPDRARLESNFYVG